jgi:F-type H+-transporting ATPase subunit b
MDKLLQPNIGLMVWTVVTFVLLVLVLTKTAWKPIIEGLNSRENKIKNDLDRAEKNQQEAEALRIKFEAQLAEAQKTIQDMMAKARADGERTRGELLETARQEAERILEKGRKELGGETDRLKAELQSEVAGLSLLIAEKILNRSVDAKIQDAVMKESVQNIGKVVR